MKKVISHIFTSPEGVQRPTVNIQHHPSVKLIIKAAGGEPVTGLGTLYSDTPIGTDVSTVISLDGNAQISTVSSQLRELAYDDNTGRIQAHRARALANALSMSMAPETKQ